MWRVFTTSRQTFAQELLGKNRDQNLICKLRDGTRDDNDTWINYQCRVKCKAKRCNKFAFQSRCFLPFLPASGRFYFSFNVNLCWCTFDWRTESWVAQTRNTIRRLLRARFRRDDLLLNFLTWHYFTSHYSRRIHLQRHFHDKKSPRCECAVISDDTFKIYELLTLSLLGSFHSNRRITLII